MAPFHTRRLTAPLCALAALAYAVPCAAAERTVASKVTAVTVFSDRAQVVRTCAETLPASPWTAWEAASCAGSS
jgi:hypothetical protein